MAPMPMPRVLCVVPALNEAHSITEVVQGLTEHGFDVLVVDDGSLDGTAALAEAAGARVARMPFNVGIGGAVQTGYIAAQAGRYDVAVQVDADGQHPVDQVDLLVRTLVERKHDLVVGSRFIEATAYRAPRMRRFGIGFLKFLLKRATDAELTDTTSGFRAAGRRAIALFARSYPADYPEVESLVVATRAGLTVSEVSVHMRQRQGGRSSITPLRSAYYMIKVSLAVLMVLMRRPERVLGE
jgi:glycosyltransferase involved in cell wall biosynthesis